MNLFDQINADIKSAMLAKEKEKLEALRAIKAAFLMAKTEKGSSDELSDDKALKIIQKLVKQRKDSAEVYKVNGREELFAKEVSEAEIIGKYLPSQLSESEIVKILKDIVAKIGAKGMQDMGKVMGMATKQFAGKADNKIVSTKVKEILATL